MIHYDRVWAEVNINAVRRNLEGIKRPLPDQTKLVAVIKADGYGHGAVQIARETEDLDCLFGFGTATIEEASALRNNGITKPLIVLGYTFPYAYEEMALREIRPTVYKEEMVRQMSECAVRLQKTIKIHLKVDTGMNRIGVPVDESGLELVRLIRTLPGIEVEGIFSHLARADEAEKEPSYRQIELFRKFAATAEAELGRKIPFKHCANSAGAMEIPEAWFELVRPGIAIYGLWPSPEVRRDQVELEPALSLKSHIVYLKEAESGSEVSYGGTYCLEETKKIATVPVGYGDGYPRGLSNHGYMLVHGKRAPILGRVCMDQCMIDVTGIPEVKDGDQVTLIGKDGEERLTVELLGELSGRFNYELACDLGKRIPRIYHKDGQIIGYKDYFSD